MNEDAVTWTQVWAAGIGALIVACIAKLNKRVAALENAGPADEPEAQ